ncbi:MAG: hypothetical protein IPG54_13245 [Sphingomonadales bacterium]|nr:hypothetical protein [Sphingomonadales bacterium]
MQFPDVATIVRDPSWLAHRYDAAGDRIQFVPADREAHAHATFLTDEFLHGQDRPAVIRRSDAIPAMAAPAPVHFIFHSAYCCSTLLARAFDVPGLAFALKEPSILNDLSGWRRRGAPPAAVADALRLSLGLLGKPFESGEQIVIKPSNVINALAPAMLATLPAARALLLYTPLPNYLASIAKKGMWGRLWVRELFVKLTRDGLTDYGFSADDILQQTDLQIAAIGWLAQHRAFAALCARFGPDRVATLQSERLLADPQAGVTALAQFYGIDADSRLQAHVQSVFGTHSKTGESFSRDARESEHVGSLAAHAEEVEKVVIWAEAVAKAAGQPMELPLALR